MSYYQILFGLLFTWLTLAGLARWLGTDSWTSTQTAILVQLSILIVSDMLMTFHWLEVRKRDENYGMIARIIDLTNFACLAAALTLVHPAVTKLVMSETQLVPHSRSSENLSLILIAVYMALVLFWSVWTTWETDNNVHPLVLIITGAPIALLSFSMGWFSLGNQSWEWILIGYTFVFMLVVALWSYGHSREKPRPIARSGTAITIEWADGTRTRYEPELPTPEAVKNV